MKKLLGILLASILVMSACGQTATKTPTATKTEKKVENTVTIKITKDKETSTISSKKISVTKGENLMDLMQKNYKIDTQYNGAFISGIDGVEADNAKKLAWMFSVNGKDATKGAKDIVLKPGDTVDFDLQKYQ